jgi:2-polyprenyl-3-methyl-5-hydroxy-6-metoxy-1,4-benzoquinol methylase
MTLDYQSEVPSGDTYRKALDEFHSFYYLRLNQRRQEHLVSLNLPLRGKRVWEVSAGIGDHTSFFLDRECEVTCSEARQDLVEIIRNRYRDLAVHRLDLEHPNQDFPGPFDVVYCYGVLYHLRTPAQALDFIAARCSGLLLLETCVSFGSELDPHLVSEPLDKPSQAISGVGCRPTRNWVLEELKARFQFVYIPKTQPNHEQFPIDWRIVNHQAPFARAIFIASRSKVNLSTLTTELVSRQERH